MSNPNSDRDERVKAPERLTKQVCPDGFIDCRAHPASSLREVRYVREDAPTSPNALPDISESDSERLQEFMRVTALEIKAVGSVGAATSLEVIGYIRELESQNTALREQLAQTSKELTSTRRFLTETQAERDAYQNDSKRYRDQLAQVTQERSIAVKFLSKQGYERCDGHCDSWHERLTSPQRESGL